MEKRHFLILLCAFILHGHIAAQNPDCPPVIFVTPMKMDVLYVGVDNPVKIACTGVSADSLDVQITGGTLTNRGKGYYDVRVAAPGEVVMTASRKDKPYTVSYHFRAKRIPDPVPALGAKYSISDTIKTGPFKAQMGIALLLQNFDFDAKCDLVEYTVTLIGTHHEDGKLYKRSVKNTGARFSPAAIEIISQGVPGDIFIFSDIKGRCTGDVKDRTLNGLTFFMEEDRE